MTTEVHQLLVKKNVVSETNNKNNHNNNYEEDFASFATRQFSTLTTIFGHL